MGKNRQKVIGTQDYINYNTGELIQMQVIQEEVQDKDAGFYKLYMRDFVRTLELVANKKEKVCYWIIDHLTKDNMLIYTYRQIAEQSGTSYDTVASTMKILLDADFLRRHNSGVYIINPDIIFKGSHSRRLDVLHTYKVCESGDKQEDAKLRLKNLDETIETLQKKRNSLAKRCNFFENNTKNSISDNINNDDQESEENQNGKDD